MVLRPRNGLSLCAGGGGLDLGLMLAEPGFHTRCFVEWEEYPRRCLIAAQLAGYFAPAPIWDNVRTFNGRPWRGVCDTVLAGYPCQPFSAAGQRKGESDPRHLWPEVARVIGECRPEWVFLENVAGHVSLGAETVLRDLWSMGYTPAAGLFSASETGAPHERLRWFCVAHRDTHADTGRVDGGRVERGAHEGEGQGAERQRLRAGLGGGSEPLAHAGRAERRPLAGVKRIPDGDDIGWQEAAGRLAESGDAVGHSARIGRREGRAEPGIRSRRDAPSGAGGTMADADGRNASTERQQRGGEQRLQPESRPSGGGCAGFVIADAKGAEREWQFRGQHHQGRWQVKDGYPAIQGGTGLFPPGPGDAAAWAAVLRSSPDMAPAAAARDLHAWARRLEAHGRAWWQAEAEPAFCRMVDGLSHRSQPLRLLGNAVHPLTAGLAWRSLAAAHGLQPIDLGGTER